MSASSLAATFNLAGSSGSPAGSVGASADVTYLAVPVRIAASPTLPRASMHHPPFVIPEPIFLPTLNEELTIDEIPAPTSDAITQTTASLDNLAEKRSLSAVALAVATAASSTAGGGTAAPSCHSSNQHLNCDNSPSQQAKNRNNGQHVVVEAVVTSPGDTVDVRYGVVMLWYELRSFPLVE